MVRWLVLMHTAMRFELMLGGMQNLVLCSNINMRAYERVYLVGKCQNAQVCVPSMVVRKLGGN